MIGLAKATSANPSVRGAASAPILRIPTATLELRSSASSFYLAISFSLAVLRRHPGRRGRRRDRLIT